MYKRILIVVDRRPVSRAAVKEGVAMAAAQGAELVLFHVMPRYSVPMADMAPFAMTSLEDFRQSARAAADRLLSTAAARAEKAGVKAHRLTGSGDDDALCIVEAARKRRCDLIIAASEGRNALMRLLTGSVIPGLITASTVPVLVVKAADRSKSAARAAVVPARPRQGTQPAVAADVPRRRRATA